MLDFVNGLNNYVKMIGGVPIDFQSQIKMSSGPTDSHHIVRKEELDLLIKKLTSAEYQNLVDNAQTNDKTIYFVDYSDGNHQIIFKNVTYSSITGLDHNLLSNIEGKGVNGEAFHLDEATYQFLLLHYSGNPLVAENIYPLDGELNVYKYPEFVGSAYYSAKQVPMYGIEIQIATDSTFTTVLYQGFYETANTYARFQDFEDMIAVDTTYWWRIRYYDVDSRYNNWSLPTSFTTASSFETTVVIRPMILLPREGQRISSVSPLLISTPFNVIGATDTHESSDWQLANHADFESSHILAESIDDTVNLTSINFTGLDLTGELGIYSRVSHKGVSTPKSSWSPIIHSLLKQYHSDYCIGIGVKYSGAQVYYIDELGNNVSVQPDYINNHPLYQFPESIVAGQTMCALGETWVRCDANQGGFDLRYWISPYQFTDSIRHPAFNNMGGISTILYGKYLSGDVNTGVTSTIGNSIPEYYPCPSPNVDTTVTDLNTKIDVDHNNWNIMSIYDRSLLTLLMLINYKTFYFNTKMNLIVDNTIMNKNIDFNSYFRNIANAFYNGRMNPTLIRSNTSEQLSCFYTERLSSNKVGFSSSYDISSSITITSERLYYNYNGQPYITALNTKTIYPDFGPLQLLFIPITGGNLNTINFIQIYGNNDSSCKSNSVLFDSQIFPIIYCAGYSSYSSNNGCFARIVKYIL